MGRAAISLQHMQAQIPPEVSLRRGCDRICVPLLSIRRRVARILAGARQCGQHTAVYGLDVIAAGLVELREQLSLVQQES